SHVAAYRARLHADRAPTSVSRLYAAEPAQVDDNTGANRASCHTASRSARNERGPRALRPGDEQRDVVFVGGDRDCQRHLPRYSCGLRINGARELVGTKGSAEAGGSNESHVRKVEGCRFEV